MKYFLSLCFFAGVCSAAVIDVRDEHYIEMSAGDQLIVSYSTEYYETVFGTSPTKFRFIGYSDLVPDGQLLEAEIVNGAELGQLSPVFGHYVYHIGPVILWEGDGSQFAFEDGPLPEDFKGLLTLRLRLLAGTYRIGDPIHDAVEDTRIGVVWQGNFNSVGAGPAKEAWLITQNGTTVPEADTGISAGISLLLAAGRRLARRFVISP